MPAILLVLFFILPFSVSAASIPAGFPTSALWLSNTAPTHGDAVTIYTVVYNSSETPLAGSVVFLVDEAVLGTKTFSMAPGTNDIIAHPWKAEEGTHAFSARLDGVSGAEDALSTTATATTTITVSAPQPPPRAVSETAEAARAVSETVVPVVSSVASSTIQTAESFRESAVRALEKLASSTTAAPEGEVLSAEDDAAQAEANAAPSLDISATIQNAWQALLGALLTIFRSSIWFYVFVGVVIILLVAFARTVMSDRRNYH